MNGNIKHGQEQNNHILTYGRLAIGYMISYNGGLYFGHWS